jgi:hypothetical protein
LVLCGRKINLEAAITMKFFGFSLFSAKADYEIPEPSAILNKSVHHPTPKPALLISFRSPGDQLQILVLPMLTE